MAGDSPPVLLRQGAVGAVTRPLGPKRSGARSHPVGTDAEGPKEERNTAMDEVVKASGLAWKACPIRHHQASCVDLFLRYYRDMTGQPRMED